MTSPPWGHPSPEDLNPEDPDAEADALLADRDDLDDGLETDPGPVAPWQLDGSNPWERQHREPSNAYEAFAVYRDLGPSRRSHSAIVERGRDGGGTGAGRGWSATNVARWSKRWRWVERARAWDDRRHKLLLEEHDARIRTMSERHANLGALLVRLAFQRLVGVPAEGDRPAVPALSASDLDPLDVIRFARYGAQIEAGAHLGLTPSDARQLADEAANLAETAGAEGDEVETIRAQVLSLLSLRDQP